MFELVVAFFEFLLGQGLYVLAAFLAVVIVRMWMYWGFLHDPEKYPESRARTQQMILAEHWGQRYALGLGWLMARVTGWIGDQERFPDRVQVQATGWWRYTSGKHPFSVQSYEFCLKLSLLYPILAFVLAWLLGGNGQLGSWALFPADASWLVRLVYGLGIAVSAGLFYWGYKLSGWRQWIAFAVALVVTLTVTVTVTVMASPTLAFALVLAVPLVVTVIVVASGGVVAGVIVVSVFAAVTGAVGLFVILVFVATFGIFAGARLADRLYWWVRRHDRLGSFWLGYTLVLLGAFTGLLGLGWHGDGLLLLFFWLLPLVNAPLDWVSLGVTRYLLQRLRLEQGWLHGVVWALLDLVLALVFLSLISAVLVVTVAVANRLAPVPLVDLQAVFSSLRNPADGISNFWIYFMVFSTLLPTLLHFALAGMALTRAVPQPVREQMVAKMDGHEQWAKGAWLYVVLTPAVGFVLAPSMLLALLYALVSYQGAGVGSGLLEWAEWLAAWIDPSLGHVPVQ